MPIQPMKYVWMNGAQVPFEDAKVHVLTHALHYGYGVFEGIRAYETPRGSAVFRLTDHINRFYESAKILMMEIPYAPSELVEATKVLVTDNEYPSCYIRPIAYLGYGEMGLNPLTGTTDVAIATWPWGAYLGEEGLAKGIRAKISSFKRHDPNIIPPAAKTTGGYINSALAKAEAIKAGYDEAIMLSGQGYVSECTGENIFIVKGGVLITPSDASGALSGITRRTITQLANDMGIETREAQLLRTDLYLADEMFITGTAAEVVPVSSVDDRPVGTGEPGKVSRELQRRYFEIVTGNNADYDHWLEYTKG
ncbi:branched-chain amino acid transaminase [Ferrimicrobium sp.]|uniref:branched-chain amino acid transaminase n=1 Tax=Ferrimicrobium sp. TaxID=2926050 RepID=UPI002614FEE9|nr:branched-chain amino acid transaminase [Ferrimicrobium sp.]